MDLENNYEINVDEITAQVDKDFTENNEPKEQNDNSESNDSEVINVDIQKEDDDDEVINLKKVE